MVWLGMGDSWYQFTNDSFSLILVAIIGAIAAWQGKRGRRVESKVDKAIEQQDTGNGKALGETVKGLAESHKQLAASQDHLAKQQEYLIAQIHTNTKETIEQGIKLEKSEERFQVHTRDAEAKYDEILDRIDDIPKRRKFWR